MESHVLSSSALAIILSHAFSSPAAAVGGAAYAEVDLGLDGLGVIGSDEYDDGGLPDGSVYLSFDDSSFDALAPISEFGPSRDQSSASGQIINSIDKPVEGSLDFAHRALMEVRFAADGERAEASFLADLFFADTRVGRSTFQLAGSSDDCGDRFGGRCSITYADFSDESIHFEIGAGESLPVTLTLTVAAKAITSGAVPPAPIPLPAALGPAALALGGLAWAGRRRAHR